jgi:hypothetical protein
MFRIIKLATESFALILGRRHTKETGNHNFRELLSDWVEHVKQNGAVHTDETATQLVEDWETQFPGNWASQSSHSCIAT